MLPEIPEVIYKATMAKEYNWTPDHYRRVCMDEGINHKRRILSPKEVQEVVDALGAPKGSFLEHFIPAPASIKTDEPAQTD